MQKNIYVKESNKTLDCRVLGTFEEAVETIRQLAVSGGVSKQVCYTAIIGKYDNLIDPLTLRMDTDLVCFTDNRELSSDHWNIVCVDFIYRDPRRTARLFKCLPHMLFPNHEVSFWIDGNFEVSDAFFEFAGQHHNDGLLCFQHPARDCLYQEAKACLSKGKDDAALIRRQIGRYRHDGMPEHYGLIASGVLVRRHHDDNVIRLCFEWLREINDYSVRDQLAFPFVAWKLGIKYSLFSKSMARAPGLRYRPHSKWIFYDRRGRKLWSLRTYFWGLYYRLRVKTNRYKYFY